MRSEYRKAQLRSMAGGAPQAGKPLTQLAPRDAWRRRRFVPVEPTRAGCAATLVRRRSSSWSMPFFIHDSAEAEEIIPTGNHATPILEKSWVAFEQRQSTGSLARERVGLRCGRNAISHGRSSRASIATRNGYLSPDRRECISIASARVLELPLAPPLARPMSFSLSLSSARSVRPNSAPASSS